MEGRAGDAAQSLQGLLRGQRERGEGFPMLLRMVPQIAQAVLAFALRERIEVGHVRRKIVVHAFAPPDRVAAAWPWPATSGCAPRRATPC